MDCRKCLAIASSKCAGSIGVSDVHHEVESSLWCKWEDLKKQTIAAGLMAQVYTQGNEKDHDAERSV
jgi:hypothetical protein